VRNDDLLAAIAWLQSRGVEVIEETPMRRMGARGMGAAFYLKDPDGYIVELKGS
jgi:extradiol dioxygenase family protein